jgi:two-component system sensor histidine kinase HydH
MSEIARLESMERYLGLTPRDIELLSALAAPFQNRREAMLDDFYARILGDPAARRILEQPERVESLKRSLRLWTKRIFGGPFDVEYVAMRSRIGERHVEIGLPGRFMPLAMGVVRQHLVALAFDHYGRDPTALRDAVCAVDRVLDLELTLMLDRYHADTLVRTAALERVTVVQQLATAVSRELKNLLGVINTSVLLLRRGLRHEMPEFENVERIARASRRIASLADHLLEFARIKRSRAQRVEARELLEEAIAQVGEVEGLLVDLVVEPRDLVLRCAASDVARAVMHLLRNGIEACRAAGRPPRLHIEASAPAPNLRCITVRDEGEGVTPEVRRRMFEPLFTTRDGAMGLGLAFARDVAQAHDGHLELDERAGPGTTFRFTIPHSDD